MYGHAAAVALVALVVPALAFAAPQHPASNARPHPAASAHSVAAAGEANARRIEACSEVSASMLAALDRGDYDAAASTFDARMQTLLDAQKLRLAWTSTVTQLGKLDSRGSPQTLLYEDNPVVATPLRFANGALVAQVACDPDGKIAGFFMRPAGAASGSAPASGD